MQFFAEYNCRGNLKIFDMKTVLIATDFSEAARNASFYGISLANTLGANVILFHSYNLPAPAAGFGVSVSGYDVKMQTDAKLQQEAAALDPGNKKMQIISEEGAPADTMMKVGVEKKVDFIITGMKGIGKNLKKIFGSTATSLLKNAEIPVIIVPEAAIYCKPEKLVFASDTPIEDHNIPEQLTSVVDLLKSTLQVVKVIQEDTTERIALPNSTLTTGDDKNSGLSSFTIIKGRSVTEALSDYIEEQRANVLVMLPHKHAWTERLLKKSETKDMLFHTRIPLMILPEK